MTASSRPQITGGASSAPAAPANPKTRTVSVPLLWQLLGHKLGMEQRKEVAPVPLGLIQLMKKRRVTIHPVTPAVTEEEGVEKSSR